MNYVKKLVKAINFNGKQSKEEPNAFPLIGKMPIGKQYMILGGLVLITAIFSVFCDILVSPMIIIEDF